MKSVMDSEQASVFLLTGGRGGLKVRIRKSARFISYFNEDGSNAGSIQVRMVDPDLMR